VTLPTPDAHSPQFLSQQSPTPSPYSTVPATRTPQSPQSPYPAQPSGAPFTPLPPSSIDSTGERAESPEMQARRRAFDFAGNSWDLATGGLKTLTAKRELPPRLERRVNNLPANGASAQRSYAFALVILACVIVMLVSGGIVLFVMLQP